MGMKYIEDIEDVELFGQEKPNIQINVEEPKKLIERGLKYFFGDKGEWLPEYETIATWLSDNKGKGLLCLGDGGRGKTFVCERILLSIIEHIYPYLKTNIIRGYTIASDYSECLGGVLFIDDIGVEMDSRSYGEKRNVFNQIVDDAERNKWLLIVTTNLTIDEIIKKYGERTMDRLRALTKPVVFKGNTLRNKK